jgi:hypothetical protein|tara:strand:+ start:5079 stop:6476 length:1398 start_codon:yes stop_codon:yes gene_type:complete
MAQHDYDIANQSGANFRADLNNALDAIVSNNSGSSEPSTKFAYEWWVDTSNNLLKLRNSANNAWITLPLSITADNATSGGLTVNGNLATTGTVDINGQELILDADADTSITADTDDQIDFRVGAVDVMTLTNSHLVLKGTTPKITIGDGGEEDTALIFNGNAQDFYIGLDDSADDLVIGTGSTVGTNGLVVVENGGNVGVGTITPSCRLHLQTPLTSDTQTTPETVLKLSTTFNSTGSDGQAGCGARLEFEIPDDETNPITASAIAGLKENGDDSNAESALAFYISQNDTTLDEAMRINSAGALLVGKTADNLTDAGFVLKKRDASDHAQITCVGAGSTSVETYYIYDNANSEFEFFVSYAGAVHYRSLVSLSDERKKDNIADITFGLDAVKELRPVSFDWKNDKGNDQLGFIAQEVETTSLKQLVSTYKDENIEDCKSLNKEQMIPVLVKAIQELEARVQTLEG